MSDFWRKRLARRREKLHKIMQREDIRHEMVDMALALLNDSKQTRFRRLQLFTTPTWPALGDFFARKRLHDCAYGRRRRGGTGWPELPGASSTEPGPGVAPVAGALGPESSESSIPEETGLVEPTTAKFQLFSKAARQMEGCSALIISGDRYQRCHGHPIVLVCERHRRVYMCPRHRYCMLCDAEEDCKVEGVQRPERLLGVHPHSMVWQQLGYLYEGSSQFLRSFAFQVHRRHLYDDLLTVANYDSDPEEGERDVPAPRTKARAKTTFRHGVKEVVTDTSDEDDDDWEEGQLVIDEERMGEDPYVITYVLADADKGRDSDVALKKQKRPRADCWQSIPEQFYGQGECPGEPHFVDYGGQEELLIQELLGQEKPVAYRQVREEASQRFAILWHRTIPGQPDVHVEDDDEDN